MNAKEELQQVKDQINQEVETEWLKHHFRWFLPKRRKNKLRAEIYHKHEPEVFEITKRAIDYVSKNAFPEDYYKSFTDIKDISIGDKVHEFNISADTNKDSSCS